MTQVTLLDTIELATFCVRTFSLHKVRKGGFRCLRKHRERAHADVFFPRTSAETSDVHLLILP